MNLTRLSLVLLLCSTLAIQAHARDGLFVSATVGSADLTENFGGFEIDSSSTAYGATVGWRFNDYFSVEGGYRNFGRFDQTFAVNDESVSVSLKADGFVLGAIGHLPLGERFGLFGKAGSFFWDGDSKINSLTVASPGDTNLYLGAGMTYDLTDRFSVSADLARYNLDDTESDVYSLGVLFSF